MEIKNIVSVLNTVRKESPLVHNITNVVVTNFVANGLLALGASPVMAYAKEEVADMVKIAGALVLNIGTLNETEVEAMIIAGKAANENNVPVILDPVGAGATPYRTITARKILEEVKVSILRGNAAEISNVIGEKWLIKGVDAGEGNQDIVSLAIKTAEKFKTTVVITGKDDVISDGINTYIVHNGHPILTKVTGTGCLLSSVLGAFAAVEKNLVMAAVSALTFYGITAEKAVENLKEVLPGSFQIEFLNQLAKVTENEILEKANIE